MSFPTPGGVGRRRKPVTQSLAWLRDVAELPCRDVDPEQFFPHPGGLPGPDAVAACESCGVRAACRAYALAAGEVGYWGGQTHHERTATERRQVHVDAIAALLATGMSTGDVADVLRVTDRTVQRLRPRDIEAVAS